MDIEQRTKGKVRELTDEELHGVPLKDIKCRSCSGYGNCGFKSYRIYHGQVVSVCNQQKDEVFKEHGIEE